jgi:hypothetical protein
MIISIHFSILKVKYAKGKVEEAKRGPAGGARKVHMG